MISYSYNELLLLLRLLNLFIKSIINGIGCCLTDDEF